MKKKVIFFLSRWTTVAPLIILNALFAPGLEAREVASDADKRRDEKIIEIDVERAESKIDVHSSGLNQGVARDARPTDSLADREMTALDAEAIRAEFIEILNVEIKRNERWRRLQMFAASLLRGLDGENIDAFCALDELDKISSMAASMASETLTFCDFIDSVLDDVPTPRLATVRIRYKLDELRRQAKRTSTIAARQDETAKPIGSSRVLTVNDDLNVVVLTVGSDQGVRNGLLWRIKIADDKHVDLKTIAVRPSISAAFVIDGAINDVVPGMTANAGEKLE